MKPKQTANRIQNHPVSFIVLQLAALIGGIAAFFMLLAVVRRMFK